MPSVSAIDSHCDCSFGALVDRDTDFPRYVLTLGGEVLRSGGAGLAAEGRPCRFNFYQFDVAVDRPLVKT